MMILFSSLLFNLLILLYWLSPNTLTQYEKTINKVKKMKKSKLFSLGLLFSVALCNTGCLTAQLWDDVHMSQKKVITYEKVSDDNIVAFGQVQQDILDNDNKPSIRKDSLIMMGQNYWYIFFANRQSSHSKELLSILRSGLPKRFIIVPTEAYENQQRAIDTAGKGTLPIKLEKNLKDYFATEFCLKYNAETDAEKAKLKALKFSGDSKCFQVSGRLYQARNIPSEYHFETPIPVSVLKTASVRHTSDPVAVAKAVIGTPFTLPLDAVAGIIIFGGVSTGLMKLSLIK